MKKYKNETKESLGLGDFSPENHTPAFLSRPRTPIINTLNEDGYAEGVEASEEDEDEDLVDGSGTLLRADK